MTDTASRPGFGEAHAYLRGVYNIVPTPFDEDGALDEASLRRLVDFVVATGVSGITILGVLGEAGKLSEAERMRTIAVSHSLVRPNQPVRPPCWSGRQR